MKNTDGDVLGHFLTILFCIASSYIHPLAGLPIKDQGIKAQNVYCNELNNLLLF